MLAVECQLVEILQLCVFVMLTTSSHLYFLATGVFRGDLECMLTQCKLIWSEF